ncbi:MAG TPA: hypothetical protein PK891_06070, partial [Bacteroidales bacterium]|nr:hypothetical protein [Bacteroidales bacterium]
DAYKRLAACIKDGKKVDIFYYGVEEVIVSIRYKKKSRGIRPSPKQADNFVSTDLQINGKNVHIKLSSDNALAMGVVSVEMAIEAVECLLNIIYTTDRNLEYFRSSSKDSISKAYSYVKSLAIDNTKCLSLPGIESFQTKLREDNYPVDEQLATLILSRGYDVSKIEDLDIIMENMTNSNLIANNDVSIIEHRICNSAYNYKLKITSDIDESRIKGCFILKNLAEAIINFQSEYITASHHNWHEKYTNVVISTYGVYKGKLLMDKKGKRKQHIHRFNISEKAGIRQWSPSTKNEAYLVHMLLVALLKEILATKDMVFIPIPTTE